jgi:hypothetical protein
MKNNRTRKVCYSRPKFRKLRGGETKKNPIPSSDDPRVGPFEYMGEVAGDTLDKVGDYVGSKLARGLGYKKIEDDKNKDQLNDAVISSELSDIAGNVNENISDVGNKLNESASALIDGINTFFENSDAPKKMSDALSNSVDIGKDIVKEASKKLNDPKVQQDLKNTIKGTANVIAVGADVMIDALDKPVNKFIDKGVEMGERVSNKLASSVINVGLNAAGIIPGIGEVIEGVRTIDSIAKTGSAVIDAGLKTVELGADLVSNSIDVINEKSGEISNAIKSVSKSVDDFKNTDVLEKKRGDTVQGGGGRHRRKTRKQRWKYTTKYLQMRNKTRKY